ncbi:hypothetical protein ACLIBH_03560 [Virgibacillus sp. W0430]|uniref:hypothetical protein n=1 Tax=Virgibacillus sp. W0430 TaxID=3391580 RepID=UPI003F474ED9
MSFWTRGKGFDQQRYQEALNKITLEKIDAGMEAYNFSHDVKNFLLDAFKERIRQQGINEFKMYIYNLHFTVPQEIEDEHTAAQLYELNEVWFDQEVKKLENELKIPFEEQAEDLADKHINVRKTQLVIRHRLSSIILDIADNRF